MNRFDRIFFITLIIMLSSSTFQEWLPKSYFLYISYAYFFFRIAMYLVKNNALKLNNGVLLLLFVCLVSSIWSFSFKETFIQAIYLIIQSLIITFIATNKSVKQVLSYFFISGAIIALASLVAVLFDPQKAIYYGYGSYSGLWEGIFYHKNNLANTMVFYVLINLFYLTKVNKKNRIIVLSTILLQTFLIFKSGSTTGLILTILIIGLFVYFVITVHVKLDYLKLALLTWTWLVAFCVGVLTYFHIEKVFLAVGKDMTLTGRSDIWSVSWELIKENLFLGYGYKGTFIEGSYFDYVFRKNFNVNSLHNGYLETLSYVGVVGLCVLGYIVIRYVYLSFKFKETKNIFSYLPIVFILYLAVLNTTESASIGSGNGSLWLFFLFCLFLLNKKSSIKSNTIQ